MSRSRLPPSYSLTFSSSSTSRHPSNCLSFVGPRVHLLLEICQACGLATKSSNHEVNERLRAAFASDARVQFEGFVLSHAQTLSDLRLDLAAALNSHAIRSSDSSKKGHDREFDPILDAAIEAWGAPSHKKNPPVQAASSSPACKPQSDIDSLVESTRVVLLQRTNYVAKFRGTSGSQLARLEWARLRDDKTFIHQLVEVNREPITKLLEVEQRRVLKVHKTLHEVQSEIHVLRISHRDELTYLSEKSQIESDIAKRSRSVAPVALNDIVLSFREAEEAIQHLKNNVLLPLGSKLAAVPGGRALHDELRRGVVASLDQLVASMTTFMKVHTMCITSRRSAPNFSGGNSKPADVEDGPTWLDAQELTTSSMPENWNAVLDGLRMFVLLCKQSLESSREVSAAASSSAECFAQLQDLFTSTADELGKTLAQLSTGGGTGNTQDGPSPGTEASPPGRDPPGVANSPLTKYVDPDAVLAATNPTGYRRKVGVMSKLSVPKAHRINRVQSLVRDAIDTDNLSAMYHGWCPWL